MPKVKAAGFARPIHPHDRLPFFPLDRVSRICVWIFCFSFVFDFKGPEGGSSVQIAYILAAFLGGVGYIFVGRSFRMPKDKPAGISTLSALWWGYLLATATTAVIMTVPIEHYLRVILPFVLTGVGILMMSKFARARGDPEQLIRALLICSAASSLWTFIYAIFVTGLDISSARFQILSPATPFLLAYGAWLMVNGRRPRSIELAAVATAVLFVILSITRSYLFIVAALFIGAFAISRRSALNSTLKRAVTILVGAVLLGLPVMLIASHLRPDFASEWSSRLFEASTSSGEDPTYLTRIAEFSGQWQDISTSKLTLLIGKGVGSEYHWDFDYARDLRGSVTGEELEGSYWYPGHSMWVYSLYSSGLLFGWIVPAILIAGAVRGYRLARQRHSDLEPAATRTAGLAFLTIIAYLAYSFTAHPFGDRMSSLILGLMTGLPFAIGPMRLRAKPSLDSASGARKYSARVRENNSDLG